jgi:3-phenylpropionate/cinnamic acid dioxygenase small subunit
MNYINHLLLVVTIGCSIPWSATAGTHPCITTLENYVTLRDNGDSKAYGMLFTEAASFSIPALNIEMKGADQIALRQSQAQSEFKTQHMLTDIQLSTREIPERVYAESRFILIQQPKNSDSKDKTVFNGKYLDELLLVKGKCLIDKRKVVIINRDTWQ